MDETNVGAWVCNACGAPVHDSVVEARARSLDTTCPTCGSRDGFTRTPRKKPYEPPRIVEESTFEGRALACGKHGHCGSHQNNS